MISVVVLQLLKEWGFRVCVIASLGANVVLSLLSRTRRRSVSGRWAAKGQLVLVFILWGLYRVAEKATTSAISSLTLCGSDVSEDEKQLVALWASFLLLHLGGPDNLTAYALEDNKLSARTWLEMIFNVFGVGYAIYKYTYGGGHSRVLFAASVIISVVGATRCIERAYALSKGSLDKMQEDASSSSSSSSPGSSKKKTEERYIEDKMAKLKSRIESKLGVPELSDREALLLAQDLFPIWRHAMVDSSVMPGSSTQLASEEILRLKWGSMCKVAEMELSLMYEVLYTKAIVAHTLLGWYYLIRFLSPIFTAAAALLFWLHQQQQGGQGIRGSFVAITYALLLFNFLLDLAWLLRALGSTWAYAYVQTQASAWLRHQVWRLHRFVVRVDPMRWLLRRDPISYRTWSGTIGRYNLLREATTTTRCPEWLVPKKIRYLSKLPPDVKGLLFQRVQTILHKAISKKPEDTDYSKKFYIMDDIRTKWGQKALDLRNRERLFPGLDIHHKEAPKFGKEFEEDVLAWHIATCLVLPYIRKLHHVPAGSEAHATAIAVMSEYMMFLVAVRRDMLPGLVLHSLCKVTHETLVQIWRDRKELLKPKENEELANDEEKLAAILRRISREPAKEGSIEYKGAEGTELLWDAVALFRSLMKAGDTPADRATRRQISTTSRRRGPKRRTPVPVAELLEFIFNVWVDKLIYVAVRCSRESHAKQLSAGGYLTIVLWMVIQHAGLFRMGELKPIYLQRQPRPKKEEPKPPAPVPPPPKKEEPMKPLPLPKLKPVPPPDWPLPPYPQAHPPQPQLPDWAQPRPPTMYPTSPPPDEDEESDDEDTKEYNTPIEYVTLY